MEDFQLQPARDLGLTHRQRTLSLHRESGLVETMTHLGWWAFIRTYLRLYHRLRIQGWSHVPAQPPFVMVANHTSHLDAMVMAAPLPWRWRDCIFPLAAGDVFFDTPAIATFAVACINALPMWRHNCGRHALGQLRDRLVQDKCVYILFPEGRRSPDGSMLEFKAGLGMLLAQSGVPVVPCHLQGAHAALPRTSHWPRPRKLILKIGPVLRFDDLPNNKEGWLAITQQTQQAIEALADD